MPAWTRDSGTMARLNAGQPVRIIVIGSFSTTGLWMLSPSATCLEPISKSPEEDNEAGELNEAKEVLWMIFPLDEDPALPLDSGE